MFLKSIFIDAVSINFSLLVIILIVVIIIILYFSITLYNSKVSSTKNEGIIRERDLKIEAIENDMKGQAQDYAQKLFDKWKTDDLLAYQKIIDEAGVSTANSMLQQWKISNEAIIRKDAANRSVRIVLGKVTEHLIPFSEAFNKFNPKDARFIGSPIDLIVFDGAEDRRELINIHFIEIKTGTSVLSSRQKKIKDAIQNGRVYWEIMNLKDFGDAVNDELRENP
jgi:predicted Holliday junction resolvase-like endonuclease